MDSTRLLAVTIDPMLKPGSPVSNTFPTAASFVNVLLKNAFTVAGVLFLVLLLVGGLTFIINAGDGDAKKAAQGQQAIMAALIGFVVIFLSYFIIQLVEVITGVSILNSGL
jgi:hypothetical protein